MPNTRLTVDPVLDILEEMGYDFDELDGDGYKRSIKEAIIKLTNKDPKDSRIGILIEELKKVKKSRKTEVKEKKTTIKASKFLPGRGKFSADDIKSNNEAEMGDDSKKDKIVAFLNGDVKDNLDDVRDDLKEIEGLLKDQNKSADDQYEEMRQGILAARKKKREEKLEDKGKKPGGGLKDKMLDMVTKPAGNFFNKIIKFVTMTFLGSVVNNIIAIIKDPSRLLDPIRKFFNVFIGMFNAVVKGLWDITGAPINFVLKGVNAGVKGIIDGINSMSGLLLLPKIDPPQIPLVSGPPQVPMIPLSETAQGAKNEEAVGMSGGGVVPGPQGSSGKDGKDGTVVGMAGGGVVPGPMGPMGVSGIPGMDGLPGLPGLPDIGGTIKKPTLIMPDGRELPGLGGGGGGTDAITAKATTKSLGTRTKDIGNLLARPFRTKADRSAADPTSQFASGFGGGGFVPYSEFTLGTGHNVINTAPENIMGYNKGGKVPGKGEGDTVPAMLTPGEFVMSKGAVDKIGADNLMAMNKAGGGTNVPKMMKFAGGGIVPGIDAPTKKKGKVTVIKGGGNKSSSPTSISGGSQNESVRFSSTDPNNITSSVVKSIYNMIG